MLSMARVSLVRQLYVGARSIFAKIKTFLTFIFLAGENSSEMNYELEGWMGWAG